jgi:hypothetical protein
MARHSLLNAQVELDNRVLTFVHKSGQHRRDAAVEGGLDVRNPRFVGGVVKAVVRPQDGDASDAGVVYMSE